MAVEGQFDNPYDALRSRLAFEKVRDSIEKASGELKAGRGDQSRGASSRRHGEEFGDLARR